ncbi:ribbon-helix-helix domain-containing protein [Thermosulfurimonas dismutans]|uniref:Predicted DNA-binding protein ribbon-helix-helix domain-containing protein n=1 Tax=Thermosulfurimonas dismutans TaxID=999894 RepID=A0A179D3L0_9BACT|nr:ribbon-helix-helix domain-containing protein [Thermosulfurimonas dismutans]OAQ20218.1 hypothetical protein TDIS_1720 [Thermosulfurimonas dismutans]
MGTVVKSIRVEEELWEAIKDLSREEKKPISRIVAEAIQKYLEERRIKGKIKAIRELPRLSLGGEPFRREDLYEDRYWYQCVLLCH